MNDLVKRLRAGTGGGKHWMELHTEAADRIEELEAQQWEYERNASSIIAGLQAQLDAVRELPDEWTNCDCQCCNEHADELKAALK